MATPPQTVPQAEYLRATTNRLVVLERKGLVVRESIKGTKKDAFRLMTSVKTQIENVQKELVQVERDMQRSMDDIRKTVAKFQYVIKKGDFERLQSRIDVLAPEKKVTKEEFRKMLIEK